MFFLGDKFNLILHHYTAGLQNGKPLTKTHRSVIKIITTRRRCSTAWHGIPVWSIGRKLVPLTKMTESSESHIWLLLLCLETRLAELNNCASFNKEGKKKIKEIIWQEWWWWFSLCWKSRLIPSIQILIYWNNI